MPKKSSTLGATSPLLSPDEVASRFNIDRKTLNAAVHERVIPAFKMRSLTVFKLADIEAIEAGGFDWSTLTVEHLPPVDLAEPGDSTTMDDQHLYSFLDMARFFRISVHEARTVLAPYAGDLGVTKDDLWALIVAGASSSPDAVQALESRLHIARLHRTGGPNHSVRAKVIERDQARCRYCGRLTTTTTRHLDHVIPKSRGGTHVAVNIVVSCAGCNVVKGTKLPHEAGMRILPAGTKPRGIRIINHMTPLPAPESYVAEVMA